ncbi:MAG: DNA polymerase III subunit delta' [Cereibacter sphaeroides]|uniref:DNA polymerase III subunit delta n=1 Tax=Cereibacter sphaeroides TaxID=1063 RepID=A0A2W5TMH2_CERSP|nr:MAG: DNA polymerase III subunit delta' [Cereibacter sphaeroides]
MARAPVDLSEPLPEADRVEGAPHPRETRLLIGQQAAEAAFLDSYRRDRLHHGWLISGPRGVGKATLAWKIARFLLATPEDDGGMFAPSPPESLDIPTEHPVARRMLALSEPRLFLLRRPWNDKAETPRHAQDIPVDEVRRMKSYFNMAAADGGRRVAIIDAADELNTSAANALLKLLEEPPKGVTLLLVSHQPSRLLPTIRSRCRDLRLGPIDAEGMAQALRNAGIETEDAAALAELSGGSVGEAIRAETLDGVALYARIVRLFGTLPRLDRMGAAALAESGAGRGKEASFDLILRLIELFLARLARAGATGQSPPEAAAGEAALIARLSPDAPSARAWADLAQGLSARVRRGRAVNLDPAALLMDMVLKIDETAGKLAPR